jgi:hypothetical protein
VLRDFGVDPDTLLIFVNFSLISYYSSQTAIWRTLSGSENSTCRKWIVKRSLQNSSKVMRMIVIAKEIGFPVQNPTCQLWFFQSKISETQMSWIRRCASKQRHQKIVLAEHRSKEVPQEACSSGALNFDYPLCHNQSPEAEWLDKQWLLIYLALWVRDSDRVWMGNSTAPSSIVELFSGSQVVASLSYLLFWKSQLKIGLNCIVSLSR